MNYLRQLATEYDFIYKTDPIDGGFVVMCFMDKPIPNNVKSVIEDIVAYNFQGLSVRYIEAKGE